MRNPEAEREKALECLRRSRRAANRADALARRIEEHERVEKQLAVDVARVQDRLAELEQQRSVLATRQSRAEALGSVRDAESPHGRCVGDIFDRWETRVAESEFDGDCLAADDLLEAEFTALEEDESLGAELDALRARRAAEEV